MKQYLKNPTVAFIGGAAAALATEYVIVPALAWSFRKVRNMIRGDKATTIPSTTTESLGRTA